MSNNNIQSGKFKNIYCFYFFFYFSLHAEDKREGILKLFLSITTIYPKVLLLENVQKKICLESSIRDIHMYLDDQGLSRAFYMTVSRIKILPQFSGDIPPFPPISFSQSLLYGRPLST